MKKTLPKQNTWEAHAQKNARHKARLYIEFNDPQKAGAELKGHPPLVALEYIYTLACAYHEKGRYACARSALETALYIRRPRKRKVSVIEKIPTAYRRYFPKDIFTEES